MFTTEVLWSDQGVHVMCDSELGATGLVPDTGKKVVLWELDVPYTI